MGNRDSSKTRVDPFFSTLYDRDETGSSWLDQLIALGSRKDIVASVPSGQGLVQNHGTRWGSSEMALGAPQALLEHLVRTLDPERVAASGGTGDTLLRRNELAAQNEDTIAMALAEIRTGRRGKYWFVLEGDSKPDALLEGKDVILCIEGKRTETGCTTSTEWMSKRAQLVRHMDAAMQHYPHKRVLGLLLVEGGGGAEAVDPSPHWCNESAAAYEPSMLEASLPHRTVEERAEIAGNILGLSTWQAACRAVNVDWTSFPDVI